MNELYKMAIDLQGVIMDFGTRWGPNVSSICRIKRNI